jgi:cell wall-associated NlpC family hydrolase
MIKIRLRVGTLVRRTGCAAICAAASFGVFAAPEIPRDPVSQFLVDKGLIGLLSPDDTAAPVSAPPASVDVATPDTGSAGENTFVRRVRDGASDMVMTAMNFIGVPYRRGGSSAEKGFDCSGFTRHIFEMSLGLVLPHRADEQARAAGMISIKRNELKPGDLVFFNTMRRTFSHVGIYIGDGKFIHSPKPGGEVRVDDLSFAYWSKRFTGARRVDAPTLGTEESAAAPVTSLRALH